jgi:hypothetical protein
MATQKSSSATQKHMGRGKLIDRLAAQVGSREKALLILRRRGHVNGRGELTRSGKARDGMTASERAIDRASKKSGRPKQDYTYDPRTNRATLKRK